MLLDGFVPLIMSHVLGCEVFQVLHTNIERNKWLSVLVSQVGGESQVVGSSSTEGQLYITEVCRLFVFLNHLQHSKAIYLQYCIQHD